LIVIAVTACGYRLPDDTLVKIQEFLDSKNLVKLDVSCLLMAIKWYKDQQMTNEYEGDVDEYLDAFVALGGQADRDGFISKDVLIEIIKIEFELTIDMVVSNPTPYVSVLIRGTCVCGQEYLKGIGGETDEINYHQFCVLLDAGTGGNPSRVSSYLS